MKNSRGMVLVTILMILLVLFVFGVTFANYFLEINRQTDRLMNISIAESTAQGLATAAINKIQLDLFSATPSDGGRLKRALVASRFTYDENLPMLSDKPAGIKEVVQDLIEPLFAQGYRDFKIKLKADGNSNRSSVPINSLLASGSWEACNKVFPLLLTVSLFPKAGRDAEVFEFSVNCKMGLAYVPFLSRFSLFIDDAGGDSDKWRFNRVKSGPTPDEDPLDSSPAFPLVLDNGYRPDTADLTDIDKFRNNRTGLVYFGGAPVILNLSPREEFSLFTGFHECRPLKNLDMWIDYPPKPAPKKGEVAVIQKMIGVADETAAGKPVKWNVFVENTPDYKNMLCNSIFRLYGDNAAACSPTLVMGKVFRGMVCARGYSARPRDIMLPDDPGFGYLKYVTMEQWAGGYLQPASLSAQAGIDSIQTVARDVLGLSEDENSYKTYCYYFAGQGMQQGYNAGLAFMATQGKNPEPYDALSGWLASVIDITRHLDRLNSSDAMTKTPFAIDGFKAGVPLTAVAGSPGIFSLVMNSFAANISGNESIEFMRINLASASEELKLGPVCSLNRILAARGLYNPSSCQLNLNGWVRITNAGGLKLVIDRPMQPVSHGGIIFTGTELAIAEEITCENHDDSTGNRPDTPKFALQIVVPNGKILVSGRDKSAVDASLVAKEVVFKGVCAKVRGLVATGRYDPANAAAPVRVHYNRNLALHMSDRDALDLVCFRLEAMPLYLQKGL